MQKQTLYLNCNYGPKGPKREVENDTFEEREQKHTHNTVPIYLVVETQTWWPVTLIISLQQDVRPQWFC